MTCPSPSARRRKTPRRPAAGTAAAGVRFENRHSAPPLHRILSLSPPPASLPLLRAPPPSKPHLAVGQLRAPPPPPPRSQDHQVFAQHNKFGTFLVPKDSMNTTKEPAADAAAVTTKMAAKIAAKQVAAEQAEAKQMTKMKKAKATKEMAENAAPAKATKESAGANLARPHRLQWPIVRLGSAWEAQAAPPEPPICPCGLPGRASVGRAFRRNA